MKYKLILLTCCILCVLDVTPASFETPVGRSGSPSSSCVSKDVDTGKYPSFYGCVFHLKSSKMNSSNINVVYYSNIFFYLQRDGVITVKTKNCPVWTSSLLKIRVKIMHYLSISWIWQNRRRKWSIPGYMRLRLNSRRYGLMEVHSQSFLLVCQLITYSQKYVSILLSWKYLISYYFVASWTESRLTTSRESSPWMCQSWSWDVGIQSKECLDVLSRG